MKTKYIFGIFAIFFSVWVSAQEINWFTLEQAEKEQEKSPEKPLFIDFYTDWCGWCKKMDASTFKDVEVAQYINDNYIPVKFDAESKEEVSFKGKTYKNVKIPNSRKGIHSFAYFSLRGRLSYPAYAILNNDGKLTGLLLGYMDKSTLLSGLKGEE